MADKLINADVLLKVLDEELEDILKEGTGFSTALKATLLVGFAKQVINDAPAVDAEPVRHGRWIEKDDECECPLCGKAWDYFDNCTETFNFCPNCGAKMDGERREDEVSE